jgi:DNA-binding transcriptional MocR family regulator
MSDNTSFAVDRSDIAVSSSVTFDGAPPPGTINLGIGQPSADLLPIDVIGEAGRSFFDEAQALELNYGVMQGDERFLRSLAEFLSRNYGSDVSPDELFVSGGNSQALDLVSLTFAKPGDTVFVEEPSYFLAFQIFRDHGLNIIGIPIDDDGLCIATLRRELKTKKPAFLYTIPSYHNPGGQSSSLERRVQLVELAIEHDFLIVADEVYQMLNYEGEPPAAFGMMTASERVVSLGSFSKILAPGMRLGWIQTSQNLREKIMAVGFVNSGGSINHLGSLIARKLIDNGALDAHIEKLKQAYRQRTQAMDDALCEHFTGIASWRCPTGGYFFWLKFDESIDTLALRALAIKQQTGFQAGTVFSSKGDLKNFMRLSFSHYETTEIHEGVSRLRSLFG